MTLNGSHGYIFNMFTKACVRLFTGTPFKIAHPPIRWYCKQWISTLRVLARLTYRLALWITQDLTLQTSLLSTVQSFLFEQGCQRLHSEWRPANWCLALQYSELTLYCMKKVKDKIMPDLEKKKTQIFRTEHQCRRWLWDKKIQWYGRCTGRHLRFL